MFAMDKNHDHTDLYFKFSGKANSITLAFVYLCVRFSKLHGSMCTTMSQAWRKRLKVISLWLVDILNHRKRKEKSRLKLSTFCCHIYIFFFFVNFWFVASRVQKFINLLKLIKFIDTNKKHGIFLDSRMKKV